MKTERYRAPERVSKSREVMASMVVFLVALPLCMGIALASGVPPALGLVTGILGGLVVGTIAGAPLQVSGPAAGLTVLVFQIVDQWGLAALGVAVLAGGVLQIAWGLLRLGRFFRAVSPALVQGMLAGIGLVIIASQIHVMVDGAPRGGGTANLLALPEVARELASGGGAPFAALLGVLSLGVLVAWSRWRPARLKVLPAALVAVVVAVVLALVLGGEARTVEVPASFAEALNVPALASFQLLTDPAFITATLGLAVIASAETLLCTTAVDRLHDGPRADYDRELAAQGVGNLLAGALGALPMTGVIVRSSANVEAGGRTRWSAVMHGGWLLLFVAALPFVLALIPTASLAAILVFTGYKLINPASIRRLWKQDKAELAIFATTAATILLVDLLSGVAAGFALSLLFLVWRIARLEIDVREQAGVTTMTLSGIASFLQIPRLSASLDAIPHEGEIRFDVRGLHYMDSGCRELIVEVARAREGSGQRVVLPEVRARRAEVREKLTPVLADAE